MGLNAGVLALSERLWRLTIALMDTQEDDLKWVMASRQIPRSRAG
jgi:hypothetical protein